MHQSMEVVRPRLRHVSTQDQDTALQRDALASAGCERIFEDKASGMKSDRIGLAEALKGASKNCSNAAVGV